MNNEVGGHYVSAPLAEEFSVKVLRSVPELEEIRGVWESWPGYRDSDMDFYLTVLRSSPEVVRPHVIVVYRGGEADAILVGRIDRRKIDFRLGYFRFKPAADLLYFVNGALRGNPSFENCELLIHEIRQSLSRGEADAAYLNFLGTDSPLHKLARSMPRFLSRDYICAPQPHFTTAIPRSVEEFYKGLSPNARWQTKTKQKKLAKAFSGAVRIRCFREAAELDNLVHDVEQVAKTSYQRGLAVGFADSPGTRERLRLATQKGWLRAYVLYLADRPCAFWVGDLNQGIFCSDYLAYDADLGKYSPGIYLITKVMEGFCNGNEDGLTEVDFEPGYAQYKEVLGNREMQEAEVYIFAPSLKGVELNLIRFLTAGINQSLKKLLGRTTLLRRIKKNWRSKAARKGIKENTSVAT